MKITKSSFLLKILGSLGAFLLICSFGSNFSHVSGANNYREIQADAVLHEDIQKKIAEDNGALEALVFLEEKANTAKVAQTVRQHARPFADGERVKSMVRHAVVDTLKDTAEETQEPLIEYLEEQKEQGNVQDVNDFFIVNSFYVEAKPAVIEELSRAPAVKKIKPNFTCELNEQDRSGNNSLVNNQSSNENIEGGIKQINAPQVWDEYGIEGEDIVIGVMDTGVNWEHEALKKKYRGYCPDGDHNHDHSWYDPVYDSEEPQDVHDDHGTHVAGTAVGADPEGENQIGVAPGARWMAANIFKDDGGADGGDILAAGQELLAPGDDPDKAPDIINNSWGAPVSDNYEWLREMVQNWQEAGIFPVVAAGNYNNGDAPEGSVMIPAIYPESIAVAATDSNNERADFSRRGPTYEYPAEVKPNISAPGVGVRSAIDGTYENSNYESKNGTSMATPHIAGAAALVLATDEFQDLELSGEELVGEVEKILYSTANPQTDSDYNNHPNYGYGYGVVDAYSAVDLVQKGEIEEIKKWNFYSGENGKIAKEVMINDEPEHIEINEYHELYVYDEITLKPQADEDYHFVGWLDEDNEEIEDYEEDNGKYTFEVNEDRILEAKFVAVDEVSLDLSAEPEEGGEVEGAGDYAFEEEVSIEAIPAEGYTFVNWTENGTEVSTEKEYTFTVEEDRELVANFEEIEELPNEVEVTNAAELDNALSDEDVATIELAADIESEDFTAEVSGQVLEGNDYQLTAELEITADDVTVKELDILGNYTDQGEGNKLESVAVKSTSPGGNATLKGSGGDLSDSTVEGDLSLSGTGYKISDSQVQGNLEITGDSNTVTEVEVDGEVTDEGEDNEIDDPDEDYVITLTANPEEGGTLEGEGTYEEGKQINVVADPAEDYKFENWTEDGEEVSTDAEYTFTVEEDRELVAHFEEEMEFTGYVMEDNGTYYEYDAEEVLESFFAPEGTEDAELFEHYSEREAAAEVYNGEYLTYDGLLDAYFDPEVDLDEYRNEDPERLEDVAEEGDVIKEVSFDEEEGYTIGDPQPISDTES